MSGFLILLLGVWGGLIPFIGPYFHYAFGGYQHWHWTTQRLWMNVVPGAVAVIGGLMLLRAHTRVGGLTAGWVALAAGVWFAIGPTVSILWHHNIYAIGAPMGGHTRQMLEWIGYFYGLGALIIGLAAFAMGRFVSRPRVVAEVADAAAVAETPVAEAPVAERAAVADRDPALDRAPVADEPLAEERAPLAEDRAPLAEEERAPVADRGPVADEPATMADRGPVADEPIADEPVADRPLADEPRATTDMGPAGTVYPQDTAATSRRRSGGLAGLFRRRS